MDQEIKVGKKVVLDKEFWTAFAKMMEKHIDPLAEEDEYERQHKAKNKSYSNES